MTYKTLKTFLACESGAGTFDWKILGAVVCALGLAVGTYAYDGTEGAVVNVENTLKDESLPDRIFPGRAID